MSENIASSSHNMSEPPIEQIEEKKRVIRDMTDASTVQEVYDAVLYWKNVAEKLHRSGCPLVWGKKDKKEGREQLWWLSEQLNSFLDEIIIQPADDVDSTYFTRLRVLLSEADDYNEFAERMNRYDTTVRCNSVLVTNTGVYHCVTCSKGTVYPTLCYDCYINHGHKGHVVFRFFAFENRVCDCGDPEVLCKEGFCGNHGQKKPIPERRKKELFLLGRYVIMKLFVRIFLRFRGFGSRWSSRIAALTSRPPSLFEDIPPFYEEEVIEHQKVMLFLREILNYGKPIKRIMAEILLDKDLYTALTEGTVDDAPKDEYDTEKSSIAKLDWRTKRLFEEDVRSLFTDELIAYFKKEGMDVIPKFEHLLHEYAFWFIRYKFPVELCGIIHGLISDCNIAMEFSKAYFKWYPAVVEHVRIICRALNSGLLIGPLETCLTDTCRCKLHISHQLLASPQLCATLEKEIDILQTIYLSLKYLMSFYLEDSLNNNEESRDGDPVWNVVIVDDRARLLYRAFWMVGKDLNSIISNLSSVKHIIERNEIVDIYVDIVKCLQGVHISRRIIQGPHIEHDRYADAAKRALLIEYVLSSFPLFKFAEAFNQIAIEHVVSYFNCFYEAVKKWLNIVDENGDLPITQFAHVTYAIPLHRHLSVIITYMLGDKRYNGIVEAFCRDQDWLRKLLIHPLRIMVAVVEERANMWIRNGRESLLLTLNHATLGFKQFLGNLDFDLIRFIAAQIDPTFFMETIFTSFYMDDIITLEESNMPLQSESYWLANEVCWNELSNDKKTDTDGYSVDTLGEHFSHNYKAIRNNGLIEIPNESLQTVNCRFVNDNKKVITAREWYEPLFSGMLRLLAELLVNPLNTGTTKKEMEIINLVHALQSNPRPFTRIHHYFCLYENSYNPQKEKDIENLVEELCDYDTVDPASTLSATQSGFTECKPRQYVIKKEVFIKYWCPILSMNWNRNMGIFNSVRQHIEYIDREQLPPEEKKRLVKLWIPFRLVDFSAYYPSLQSIGNILLTETIVKLFFACLGSLKEEMFSELTYQLMIYLLTLAVQQLSNTAEVDRKVSLDRLFRFYRVQTPKTEFKASVFSNTLLTFATEARKLDNPRIAFNNIFNDTYDKKRLVGGPVEYLGRFLTILAKIHPESRLLISICRDEVCTGVGYESPTKEENSGRRSAKLLQKRLMEEAQRKGSDIMKKFADLEGESPEKKSNDNLGPLYDCPICCELNVPSTLDNPIGIAVKKGRSTLLHMQAPYEDEIPLITSTCPWSGWKRPSMKMFFRYLPSQQLYLKQLIPLNYHPPDWKTCGHTFHIRCFREYQEIFMRDQEARHLRRTLTCTTCRSDVTDILPLKIHIERPFLTSLLNINNVITYEQILGAVCQVATQVERPFLNESVRGKLSDHYAGTSKVLNLTKEKVDVAPVVHSIKNYVDMAVAVKRLDLPVKRYGHRVSLLEHMIPAWRYRCSDKETSSIVFGIRDLLMPKGPHTVQEVEEKLRSFHLKRSESPLQENAFPPEQVQSVDGISDDDMMILMAAEHWKDPNWVMKQILSTSSTTRLFEHDFRFLFTMIMSAFIDSNLLDNDKKAICLIIFGRLLGAYLVKSIFILVQCVTEKAAKQLRRAKADGLKKLTSNIMNIILSRQEGEIHYLSSDEGGLSLVELLDMSSNCFFQFAEFGQIFLTDVGILNFETWNSVESICGDFQKSDISKFVPGLDITENWLHGLQGRIGHEPARQKIVPTLTWKPFIFLDLPEKYSDLGKRYLGVCCEVCGTVPNIPLLCLFCGQILCLDTCCKYAKPDEEFRVNETDRHTQSCQYKFGLYLAINSALILILYGELGAVYRSIYLDDHGEENISLLKELYLNHDRLKMLQLDWLNNKYLKHAFSDIPTLTRRLVGLRNQEPRFEDLIDDVD